MTTAAKILTKGGKVKPMYERYFQRIQHRAELWPNDPNTVNG